MNEGATYQELLLCHAELIARSGAMAKLRDRVPHLKKPKDAEFNLSSECTKDCPACGWEKMKKEVTHN